MITKSNRLLAAEARAIYLGSRAPRTAIDIISKAGRYGDLTDRQYAYVKDLLDKATVNPPQRAAARPTFDLSRIQAMFATASAQLKRPFVIFATYKPDPADPAKQIVDAEFRISLAPETGKNPGCLYVKQAGTYAGKIDAQGVFTAAREARAGILEALAAFAADPARAALAYGQATSACCFCAIKLEDPVSVEVGYGPICAKRWGLPHRHTGVGRFVAEEVE